MEDGPSLQEYLAQGVEDIVATSLRASLKDPRESAFMARFAVASRKATQRRDAAERAGEHIPPFLIASITSSCNLHCEGCYSRYNQETVDAAPTDQLTDEEWLAVFREADELGVSFILLAGGEPLLRRGVVEAAAKMPQIVFPVFTNGTFVDERYLGLFDRSRNLVPVLSIEGDREKTDARRGAGVFDTITATMDALHDRGLLFGVSLTVTSENVREVLSPEFIDGLTSRGCKLVVYVELVPMTRGAQSQALDADERALLHSGVERLRREHEDAVFLSFPGDERASGGCIAAGRGFIHINSHGDAEPCPFSPYSDTNVRDTSLRQALRSPLFAALQSSGTLNDEHVGGCVLHERQRTVEELLARESAS